MAPTPPKAPAAPVAPLAGSAPASQAAPTAVDDGVKYCFVCGQGSHRTDWIKKFPDGSVACDSHSQEEIAKAQAKPKAAAAS